MLPTRLAVEIVFDLRVRRDFAQMPSFDMACLQEQPIPVALFFSGFRILGTRPLSLGYFLCLKSRVFPVADPDLPFVFRDFLLSKVVF